MNKLEELLSRNNLTLDNFFDESYSSLLVSIFQIIVDELEDNKELKAKTKDRIRNSLNLILTIKNIVKEVTSVIVNDEESMTIMAWINAYFNKKNKRIVYDFSIRNKLLESQKNHCNICKKDIDNSDSELDHIVPWHYVGDELGLNNLQMLCRDCNRHKSKSSSFNLKMFLIQKK